MMDLHGQIMNIKCEPLAAFPFSPGPIASEQLHAYKVGHRDARHAAAELATEADAKIAALRQQLDAALDVVVDLGGEVRLPEVEEAKQRRKDAERYRWLAERLLAADFDYGGDGTVALVFELPPGCSVSADCDATIDAAMATLPHQAA